MEAKRIVLRLPISDDNLDAVKEALTAIASNIEPEKLIKLGELAKDRQRLARALKFLPFA